MSGPSASAQAVIDALRDRGASLVTAESLTGGLLCATLVDVAGASEVVRGSVVAYAADLKTSLLGVPEETLSRVGTVAAETAIAMAAGARDRLGSTFGLATTGVAGPDGTEGKPVGTAFVAVVGPAVAEVRRLQLSGDRADIRSGAAAGALALLREVLERESPVVPESTG